MFSSSSTLLHVKYFIPFNLTHPFDTGWGSHGCVSDPEAAWTSSHVYRTTCPGHRSSTGPSADALPGGVGVAQRGAGRVPGLSWLCRASQGSPAGSVTSQNRSDLEPTGITSLSIEGETEVQRRTEEHSKSWAEQGLPSITRPQLCSWGFQGPFTLPPRQSLRSILSAINRSPPWPGAHPGHTQRQQRNGGPKPNRREGWSLPGPHHHTRTGFPRSQVTPHIAYSRKTILFLPQLPRVHEGTALPMAAQSEFRGPGGPCVCGRIGYHSHSARLLFQVFPESWPLHLPSEPAPSCPAGSRCPLPPSPPTSEARSPVSQTDSGCPCRSGRKRKPGVRPGWPRIPTPQPLRFLCVWCSSVLTPTPLLASATERKHGGLGSGFRALMDLEEGHGHERHSAYRLWLGGWGCHYLL